MRYQVSNDLAMFEFHDALFTLTETNQHRLVFIAKAVNIHHGTQQNPGETDLAIDQALLTFDACSELTAEPGRFWVNGKPNGEQVILRDDAAMQLLKAVFDVQGTIHSFNQQQHVYSMDCCGGDEAFVTFTWTAASVSVEWDAYSGPAWYESSPAWKKQRMAAAIPVEK